MSQRMSGYARQKRDLYETPEWVTLELGPHLPFVNGRIIWEPAAGNGKMVAALQKLGFEVAASDRERDFLTQPAPKPFWGIVTNPPFNLATEFIERALFMMPPDGIVAMLLRTDFDHAKTRKHLFSGEPRFSKKVVLRKRIIWFDRPGAAPSFNHAWFIWDGNQRGAPSLAYAA